MARLEIFTRRWDIFYRELSDEGRANLVVNIARGLSEAQHSVQTCMIQQLSCASLDLGYRLEAELDALSRRNVGTESVALKWNQLATLAENGLTTVHARCL
ncbi:MAG: hypothetical protein FJ146_10760 [Deltaproteobacteria bacterium]|nr:hypothetical protein [Deltaproteobacteria bacterium]